MKENDKLYKAHVKSSISRGFVFLERPAFEAVLKSGQVTLFYSY